MRRWMTVGAVAALLLFVALAVLVATRPPGPDGATVAELHDLSDRLDEISVLQAEQDGDRIRETTERLERLESDLTARLQRMEQETTTAVPPAADSSLAEELALLKQELALLQFRQAAFKRVEKLYGRSVLLILVRYDLVSGSERSEGMGFGTGFFVTPDGLIATSKHVVQPWKFGSHSVKLLEHGYRLDESSVRYVAWTSGANLFDDSAEAVESAYDSALETLTLTATAPDRFEQREEPLPDGTLYEGRFHVQSDADLALLDARVRRPVVPLRLATDLSSTEKLDPVMVLGFPSGPAILESGRAETSPSLGEVRKIEETVYVTAPIVPGNSGGPVIDQNGRVIAIATRTASGEATLGSCIKSRHLLPLLPKATELVREAEEMLDQGLHEHGRVLLELAAARKPGPADRSRIRALGLRLESER